MRYTYALQHQQGGGSSASSDGSSGHVLFQAGSTGIGRLWIRAGGAARTAHARVAAEASTAAASCLPPAQTLTPRFWELEVVGIVSATWWAQLRRGPTFMYLALLTCWSVTFFSRFRLSPETPREHWEGLFPVLLHHGGGTWYDSRGILQV